MFSNLTTAWKRPLRAARLRVLTCSSEVLEGRTILSGVTALALHDPLQPVNAKQTPGTESISIGSAPMLGLRTPDELDERRRNRMAGVTMSDDSLHGECVPARRFEGQSNAFEIDNADVLKGFEEGDPAHLIVGVTDPADDVPTRVGDRQSLSLQIFEGSGVYRRVPRFA